MFIELCWSEALSLALERIGTSVAVLGRLLALLLEYRVGDAYAVVGGDHVQREGRVFNQRIEDWRRPSTRMA